MLPLFHLAFPVKDLEQTRMFLHHAAGLPCGS